MNTKKKVLNVSEFLIGSKSAIVISTLSILKTSIGISIVSSSALITSNVILITKKILRNLK